METGKKNEVEKLLSEIQAWQRKMKAYNIIMHRLNTLKLSLTGDTYVSFISQEKSMQSVGLSYWRLIWDLLTRI